jgi:signal-transduction protein with cAMP-binding, CBS, and nucleotidyltransferase domain
LEKIVKRALQKDPAKRYKMGLDMASELATACSYLDRPQDEISIDEKFSEVKQLNFFLGFADADIWEILRASIWQEFKEGEQIISEGEIDDCFYIIISGNVKVLKGGKHISGLQAGDCFGEMGYITKFKRTATIVASGPASIIKINSTLIEQVSADCQLRFCKTFLRTLIRRLSQTTEVITTKPR